MDNEAQHKALFEAHSLIAAAGSKLHGVATAIHGASRYREEREKMRTVLSGVEAARDQLDDALATAGKARTEFLRATGCDGSCTK